MTRAKPRATTLRLLSAAAALLAAAPLAAQEVDYRRAEQLLGWNLETRVMGATSEPEWLRDGTRFWYRVTSPRGAEFMLVDPASNTRRPVFDNARLAAAMSVAADTSFTPVRLPFEEFEFGEGGRNERVIEFTARGRGFVCDIVRYSCTVGPRPASTRGFVRSPDGAWEAFVHEHNLYVRPAGGGDSIQLTTDGVEYWGYGLSTPRPGQVISGTPREPGVEWSPDSRKIIVSREDERGIEHLHFVSSTAQRPRHYSFPYALPGDSVVPRPGLHLIDVETRSNLPLQIDPEAAFVRTASAVDSLWSEDASRFRFITFNRGWKTAKLHELDVATGSVRELVRESNRTYVDLSHRGAPNWAVVNGGRDVLWFSERDGWGHLYRFAGDGTLKGQVTSGPWLVDQLHHIDEAAGRIYFTAWGREPGRNPYHAHLYRVNFDGSGLTLLTPEDAHHEISFSPDGRYLVDRYSRLDQPPVTVLRSADGRVIRTLEEADASAIAALGWTPPEPFVVKGRDGITDVYGVMYKPSHFDPSRKYPVVNNIYPGPQIGSVRTWGFEAARRQDPHALAELGFVVVQFDHMGSPFRSKAFHDAYYGRMGDHGLPDHVAGMKQLAARHPYLDLDRVGIYGHSGGGFASTGAILQYPDFFDVAVSRAGNHDNRTYGIHWGEKYQGLMQRDSLRGTDSYENQVNYLLAKNLKGKLLLIHGDMDDNVHPAMTIQVVDALIKANKSFDLLIMPDRAHGLREPYVVRRTWDYFVEHLLGVEPPENYEIVLPTN